MNIVIVLEGVFHQTTILIDERPVATNRIGWTEIEVDIAAALNGAEAFSLRVDAYLPDDRDYARDSISQSLAGKQDWYGVRGGVWKPARLAARNPLHLRGVAIRTSTDLKSDRVSVSGTLSLPAATVAVYGVSRAVVAR